MPKISALPTPLPNPLTGSEFMVAIQETATPGVFTTGRITIDDCNPTLKNEVVTARGAYPDLDARLDYIESIIPAPSGLSQIRPISGGYFHTGVNANSLTTQSGASNRLEISPWVCNSDVTVDQIGTYVTVSGSTSYRLVIYDATSTGMPNNLIWQSASITPSTSTTYFFEVPPGGNYTFVYGQIYWLGIHWELSTSGTHRALSATSCQSIGLISVAGSQGATALRRTVTYGSGAPASWGAASVAELVQITPVAFIMRAM